LIGGCLMVVKRQVNSI